MTTAAAPLEFQVEPASGFFLEIGSGKTKPAQGFHVRYRRQGDRRWSRFFLESGVFPPDEMIEKACEAHEEGRA